MLPKDPQMLIFLIEKSSKIVTFPVCVGLLFYLPQSRASSQKLLILELVLVSLHKVILPAAIQFCEETASMHFSLQSVDPEIHQRKKQFHNFEPKIQQSLIKY